MAKSEVLKYLYIFHILIFYIIPVYMVKHAQFIIEMFTTSEPLIYLPKMSIYPVNLDMSSNEETCSIHCFSLFFFTYYVTKLLTIFRCIVFINIFLGDTQCLETLCKDECATGCRIVGNSCIHDHSGYILYLMCKERLNHHGARYFVYGILRYKHRLTDTGYSQHALWHFAMQ